MKKSIWQFGALLFLFTPLGDVPVSAQTQTVVMARMGMQTFATGHYFEAYQTRGRWVPFDVYYIDFGKNNYREVALGGGAILYDAKRFTVTEEAYLDQATGPSSHAARYFVPWTLIGYRITSKIRGETVYFPYFPLNKQGRIQHILERAKLEYNFKHFKIGAGYGSYQFGDRDWQHKPFLTTTLKGGSLGDWEFWLQRLPGNHVQAQIRYRFSYRSKKKS